MDRARWPPILRALLHSLDFSGEPFACRFDELFAAALGDLAQLGLLFRRQQILDRRQQGNVEMLQLALDIEDLVELRANRRFIHAILFREHRERSDFAFQLHL